MRLKSDFSRPPDMLRERERRETFSTMFVVVICSGSWYWLRSQKAILSWLYITLYCIIQTLALLIWRLPDPALSSFSHSPTSPTTFVRFNPRLGNDGKHSNPWSWLDLPISYPSTEGFQPQIRCNNPGRTRIHNSLHI